MKRKVRRLRKRRSWRPLLREMVRHAETSPALSGGDVDADWSGLTSPARRPWEGV
jgi:hypothetical protein